jgi:hypothetical protein
MTLEEYRMKDVNQLTQPGAIGPEQTIRHSAEHFGSYAHNPAPHMAPAPVNMNPPVVAAEPAVESDAEAE